MHVASHQAEQLLRVRRSRSPQPKSPLQVADELKGEEPANCPEETQGMHQDQLDNIVRGYAAEADSSRYDDGCSSPQAQSMLRAKRSGGSPGQMSGGASSGADSPGWQSTSVLTAPAVSLEPDSPQAEQLVRIKRAAAHPSVNPSIQEVLMSSTGLIVFS